MKELNLDINNTTAIKEISVLGNALASPIRVKILQNIKNNGESITNLAKQCYVSFSSIMFHLKLLQEADLIKIVVVEKNNRKHWKFRPKRTNACIWPYLRGKKSTLQTLTSMVTF